MDRDTSAQSKLPGTEFGHHGTYVEIAGMIGSKRSVLATEIAKRLDLPVSLEELEEFYSDSKSLLADFYQDPAKHSFSLQIYLLNRRFRRHQQMLWQGGGVQDRCIYEDSVFAKMLSERKWMDNRDYRNYVQLFCNLSNFMRKPTIIVYLDLKPEVSLKLLHKRGRPTEALMSIGYLKDLYTAYEEFVHNISKSIPVIRIEYDPPDDAIEAEKWLLEVADRVADECRKHMIRTLSPPTTPRK